MRKSTLIAICAAPFLFSAPALASQDSGPAEAAAEDEIDPQNRIVCRRVPPPTGSRIGHRRICNTQSQWDRLAGESREVVDEAYNRSKAVSSN